MKYEINMKCVCWGFQVCLVFCCKQKHFFSFFTSFSYLSFSIKLPFTIQLPLCLSPPPPHTLTHVPPTPKYIHLHATQRCILTPEDNTHTHTHFWFLNLNTSLFPLCWSVSLVSGAVGMRLVLTRISEKCGETLS